MRILRTLTIGVLFLFPVESLAGSVIVLNTQAVGGNSPAATSVIYLDGKHIRIDSKAGGTDVTVIYNEGQKNDGVFWLIDNQGRAYTEISQLQMQEAKAEIEDAIAMAKKEFEQLPPDQRDQAAQVFAERVGLGAFMQGEIDYKKIASGIEIHGWKCSHYEGLQKGQKVQEVWAAELAELGISAGDLSAMSDIADLFMTVGQPLPAFFRFGGDSPDAGKFPGFPVMIVSYSDGRRQEKSEVAEVRKESLGAELFALPEGLTERPSPLGQ